MLNFDFVYKTFSQNNYADWRCLNERLPSKRLGTLLKNILPFTILLPTPVGRFLHTGHAVGACVYTGWQLATEESKTDTANTWALVRDIVDLGASFSTSKWAAVGHTAVSLGEHLSHFSKAPIDTICVLAAETLSLSALFCSSKKTSLQLTLASLGVQAAHRFYSAYKAASSSDQDYKIMTVLSNGLMGCIHTMRAYGCYQELQTIQRVVHHIFILMRHADREKGVDADITENGIARSKAAAATIEQLRQEYGYEKIQLVVSSLLRSQHTGVVIAEELGIPLEQVTQEARIREKTHNPIPRKERKNTPEFQHHRSLSSKEQFYHRESPDIECKFEVFSRMKDGIQHHLNQADGKTLLTFVSHGEAIRACFRGLQLKNEGVFSDDYFKNSKYCEISLVEVTGSFMQGFVWKGLKRVRVELINTSSPTPSSSGEGNIN